MMIDRTGDSQTVNMAGGFVAVLLPAEVNQWLEFTHTHPTFMNLNDVSKNATLLRLEIENGRINYPDSSGSTDEPKDKIEILKEHLDHKEKLEQESFCIAKEWYEKNILKVNDAAPAAEVKPQVAESAGALA